MTQDRWHISFDPKSFFTRVDINKFIHNNKYDSENRIIEAKSHFCILCNKTHESGLLLNDKSYLCEPCLKEVSAISYPEIYECRWREYLKEHEARRVALEQFISKNKYVKGGNYIHIIAAISLLPATAAPTILIASAFLFVMYYVVEQEQNRKLQEWEEGLAEWKKTYPEPSPPILKHFHDPEAELTERDHAILKVFNNWPGDPPFWNYLRRIILERDNQCCQVTGCPSRVELHIHHKKPRSQGGQHTPENLVTLCAFHHALEPDTGHEKTWKSISSDYFTIVRGHYRSNTSKSGSHYVETHLRRLELVSNDDLIKIQSFYHLLCSNCYSNNLKINVDDKYIYVNCKNCRKEWCLPRELAEESGPKLAELLIVNANQGKWPFRHTMVYSRSHNISGKASSDNRKKQRVSSKRQVYSSENNPPSCPKCGNSMRLIVPKKGQKWKKFWGCRRYRSHGCRGSIKAE